MKKHTAFILIVQDKNTEDIMSLPMIFDVEQIADENFDFTEHIEEHLDLLFVQPYDALKHQLLAIRKLAKSHNINLDTQ